MLTLIRKMRLLFIISFLLSISSCKNDKLRFDKTKWDLREDPAFVSPYREKMIDDLVLNYKLTNIKYSELRQLLGAPEIIESSSVVYTISEYYGTDIDPVYSKSIEFKLSADSIITSYEIKEWKK